MKNNQLYVDGQKVIYEDDRGFKFFGVVNELNEEVTKEKGEPHYWMYETTAGFRHPVHYKKIISIR